MSSEESEAQTVPRPSGGVDAASPSPGTIIRRSPKALSQRDPVVIAEHFYRSGFFPDVRSMSQAVVKIIAGEELGLPPMAAMQGLTMIEGRLGMTGNLVATKIKQHDDYDYRVKEKTNERCEVEFGPAPAPGRDASGEWLPWPDAYGSSEFTVEDAKRAGLVKDKSNWAKYPRAMCFNRALTEGVRTYIPDVTAGTPVYSTEEIEEVIQVEAQEVEVVAPNGSALDPSRVDHLLKGIELVKPQLAEEGVNWLDGLNVRLGALGIDGFKPDGDLAEQLANLSPEQADALDVELQSLADAEVAEADGEEEGEADA